MTDNGTLRLEWWEPGQLAPNPANWRTHPAQQVDTYRGIKEQVGWAGALLYNEATGRLIDGHLRRDEAERDGERVPVLVGSWTEEQEALVLASLDPIAAMAEADEAVLGALLQDIEAESGRALAALAAGGEAEIDRLLSAIEVEPYGKTATDRGGQGVSSTWDQVKSATAGRVIIDDIETRLDDEIVQMLRMLLIDEYEQRDRPIHETLEAVIVAGVNAVAHRGT